MRYEGDCEGCVGHHHDHHHCDDDECDDDKDDDDDDEKVLRTTVRKVLDELSKGNAVLVHCAQGKYVPSFVSIIISSSISISYNCLHHSGPVQQQWFCAFYAGLTRFQCQKLLQW